MEINQITRKPIATSPVFDNPYNVEISFIPRFRCANGEETISGSQLLTIKPGPKKSVTVTACFFYPCGGKQVPLSVGLRNIKVRHL